MGSPAYDATVGALLRLITGGHRLAHRISGGRLGPHLPGGGRLVWVSTLGRASGQWRSTPLLAVPDSDSPGHDWVVAGSNGGRSRVPDWARNLQAHPEGFVELEGRRRHARFEQVAGPERDELYARMVLAWRGYRGYAAQAGRDIPVFRVRLGDPE